MLDTYFTISAYGVELSYPREFFYSEARKWISELDEEKRIVFDALCNEGCDSDELGAAFYWLSKPKIEVNGKAIPAFPLDDVTDAFDPGDEKGPFSLRQIKAMQTNLTKLADKVERLNWTPFALEFNEKSPDPHKFLQNLCFNLQRSADRLAEMIEMWGDQYARRQEGYSGVFLKLCEYVKEMTGKPHYNEIALLRSESNYGAGPDGVRQQKYEIENRNQKTEPLNKA